MSTEQHSAILAVLLLASLTACDNHHGGSKQKVSPTYSFTLVELEPNNSVLSANVAGPMLVGDLYTIFGSITDSGHDPFDGFAFFPQEDLDIEFSLYADNPNALLEICCVDPYATVIPICWNTSVYPARGTIPAYAGQELHLVITSLWSASNYELHADAFPPLYVDGARTGPAAAELEAEAAPDSRRLDAYLGAITEPLVELAPQADGPRVAGRLYAVDQEGEVHSYDLEFEVHGSGSVPVRDLDPFDRMVEGTADVGSLRAP